MESVRQRRSAFVLCALLCSLFPEHSFAWGRSAHRLVVSKAVETLPADIRSFFDSNRAILSQHVTDPLDVIAKTPTERHNHFILLDKYGRFPFEPLPRSYKAAVTTFGTVKLDANRLLPCQICVYTEKLTQEMNVGRLA